MRVYRKGQSVTFRILLQDSSGPICGYNTPESDTSIDQQNPSTSGIAIELTDEKFINFTPSFPGLLIGVELYVVSRGSGENARLYIELQRYNGSIWETLGYAVKPTSELNENEWNLAKNFVKYSSFVLTPEANRWRFRIYEVNAETHSKLGTSDGINISYKQHSASVHAKIYSTDLSGIRAPDRPYYPTDILATDPLEEDNLFMGESELYNPLRPECIEGVYLLNLPHGFQTEGEFVVKMVDERKKGRKLEQVKIVSGIVDGFSTLLLEVTEEELALSAEFLTRGTLEIFRGDSVLWHFTVVDRFGNPVDLTGASIYLTVKDSEESTSEIIAVAGSLTNPREGQGSFYIPPGSTAISPGVYVSDIELVLPTGDIRTLFKGSFVVKSDVRR